MKKKDKLKIDELNRNKGEAWMSILEDIRISCIKYLF